MCEQVYGKDVLYFRLGGRETVKTEKIISSLKNVKVLTAIHMHVSADTQDEIFFHKHRQFYMTKIIKSLKQIFSSRKYWTILKF